MNDNQGQLMSTGYPNSVAKHKESLCNHPQSLKAQLEQKQSEMGKHKVKSKEQEKPEARKREDIINEGEVMLKFGNN